MEMRTMSTYKEIYIISYIGEYELKKARLLINLSSLNEFDDVITDKLQKHLQKHFDTDDEIDSLYEISGTDAQLNKIAIDNANYLIELLNRLYGIGADDGHYDYFPDLVDQFYQLCEQTNNKTLYNITIKQIREHEEYNDEDEEIEFNEFK